MGGFFDKLFGRGGNEERNRPSRVNEQDRAILSLKQQRDKLHKYQKRVNTQMAKEKEVAKQLLIDGKREKAKLLLKKKRYLESLLDKTDTQLDNLQQMVEQIEFTQVEMQVVEGLKQGNECLEQMHKIMSLEEVERIMGDTQDSIEYQREIDELLGQNLTQEDEDAIADELDSLLAAKLPDVPTGAVEGAEEDIESQLPEVPTGAPREAAAEKQRKQAVPA